MSPLPHLALAERSRRIHREVMAIVMTPWRSMMTVPNWHGHPSLGWHRVAATGRWHLYETYLALGMMPPAERSRRNCDDAEADHARRPQLYHRDLVRLRRGDVVCASCASCAARRDALAALPIHPDDQKPRPACYGGPPESYGERR